jgi:alginate O-acetyltransferase complex protein AlgI
MVRASLRPAAWLPLLLLPLGVGLLINRLPPWIFMWLLAGSVFTGCKWLVLQDAVRRGKNAPMRRKAAFMLGWPGMDAEAFLRVGVPVNAAPREWSFAFGKAIFGALLYWEVARLAGGGLLSAWIGMIGIIFILHFGSFHILALAWQSAGVPAEPLMNNPAAAVSVSEFWSRRWNVAFNQIAERFVFRPLSRRWGIIPASTCAFAVSGLIHDIVISVPALGGYGLPTIYFLFQAVGVCFERSDLGSRMGLRCGFKGRLFAIAVTASPAVLLFHPPFARQIILPMMSATCAL